MGNLGTNIMKRQIVSMALCLVTVGASSIATAQTKLSKFKVPAGDYKMIRNGAHEYTAIFSSSGRMKDIRIKDGNKTSWGGSKSCNYKHYPTGEVKMPKAVACIEYKKGPVRLVFFKRSSGSIVAKVFGIRRGSQLWKLKM